MTWKQESLSQNKQQMILKYTNNGFVILLLWFWIIPAQGNVDFVVTKTDCLAIDWQQREEPINLQTECADVYQVLQKNGLLKTFNDTLSEHISVRQLTMLKKAIQIEDEFEVLDSSSLDVLLASIYIEKEKSKSFDWSEPFFNWLKSLQPEKYETELNWLVNFLQAITPSAEVGKILLYSIFGLIILGILGLVLWEMYIAGILTRRKNKPKQTGQVSLNTVGDNLGALSLTEIKQLAPAEQPIALLKTVIAYLIDNQSLPKNKALTNSELKQCLKRQKSSSALPFSMLLTEVEPVLYGNLLPTEKALENCWRNARQIFS